MFFIKKKPAPRPELPPKEVRHARRETKKASKEALKSSQQLNKLLLANGITLKIHIATGGHGGSH